MSNNKHEIENLEIVDTSEKLTIEELQELKKLAHMSKFSRTLIAIVIGFLGVVGVPAVLEWVSKHVH